MIFELDVYKNKSNYIYYDANGNITKKELRNGDYNIYSISGYNTYTYGNSNWPDQLTAYNGQAITYDNAGNPTNYMGKAMTWQNGNQLATINNPTHSGINWGMVTMQYDYSGLRVSKHREGGVNNNYQHYYYDGNRLMAEDHGGRILWFYYDQTGISGMRMLGTDYVFEKNILGDVTAIYSSSGTLVGSYSYDAWGKTTVNNISSDVATWNPFRYRGYYQDQETGFYYLQSRYYDPETGRFISPDNPNNIAMQLTSLGGTNLYAYCLNNPVMYTDSTGHWFLIDDLVAAIAGLVSGLVGTFVGDLITGLFTGQCQFSSWETYLGSAVGGAVGGWATLYVGPVAGVAIGAGLGSFSGQGLESLTGTNVSSFNDIILNSLISAGIGAATAGFTKFLKIPGITSGSHNFSQVWKSGATKTIYYGFNMSLKTIGKGFVSSLASEFTVGWLLSNVAQGGINAFRINMSNINRTYSLLGI